MSFGFILLHVFPREITLWLCEPDQLEETELNQSKREIQGQLKVSFTRIFTQVISPCAVYTLPIPFMDSILIKAFSFIKHVTTTTTTTTTTTRNGLKLTNQRGHQLSATFVGLQSLLYDYKIIAFFIVGVSSLCK